MKPVSPLETIRLWHRPVLRAGIIVALTLVAYLPAMDAGFVWDDNVLLYESPLIRADDGLYRFWFTTDAYDYFPLVWTSLWLEWRLWGMDARGYHVVNVLLHALSSVVLWRVLRRLAIPGAWLAALIFAVHPVNVESVAWISERKNTLPMVFYASALLCYLRFEHTARWRWYGLALFSFLLALLGKTSVVTLPLVLLGLAWWQQGRITRTDLWRSVPFFVLALVLGLVTVWFQYNRSIGDDVIRTDSFLSRVVIAGWAVWFYVSKALVPYELCFVYPRWEAADTSAVLPYLPGVALVACLGMLFAYRRTWGRPLLAGLGYFVVTLLPVLGFLNIYFMRYSLVADHWQYVSLIGIIALLVGLGCHFARGRDRAARVLAGVAVVVVGLCSVLTWRQARVYHDSETLYLDTLAKNPSAWLAHNNLGMVYHRQGRYAEAKSHLDSALELYPDYALAHYNLGVVLMSMGDFSRSIGHLEESVRLNPRAPETHNDLGVVLVHQGRLEEACERFAEVVRLNPRSAQARNNLGQAWLWLGNLGRAIAEFEMALRLNPNSAEAHYNLGNVLAGQGRPDQAAVHFAEAVRLAPNRAEAHNNLGRALADLGRSGEAVTHYRTAVRLAPRFARAYWNLTAALVDLGRFEEAVQVCGLGLSIEPANADGHCRLGDLLARLGRIEEAVVEYRRALEIDPRHLRAQTGWEAVSAAPD